MSLKRGSPEASLWNTIITNTHTHTCVSLKNDIGYISACSVGTAFHKRTLWQAQKKNFPNACYDHGLGNLSPQYLPPIRGRVGGESVYQLIPSLQKPVPETLQLFWLFYYAVAAMTDYSHGGSCKLMPSQIRIVLSIVSGLITYQDAD